MEEMLGVGVWVSGDGMGKLGWWLQNHGGLVVFRVRGKREGDGGLTGFDRGQSFDPA